MKSPMFYFLALYGLCFCHSVAANKDGMQLLFDGDVVATPCRLVSSNQVEVNFGSQHVSQVNESGRLRGEDIIIKLDQCPRVTTYVLAQIKGESDPAYSDFYKNQGSAKNLAISIYDPASNIFLGNGATVTAPVVASASSRTAEFQWQSWLEIPKYNATDGTINGVVTVSLTYQ